MNTLPEPSSSPSAITTSLLPHHEHRVVPTLVIADAVVAMMAAPFRHHASITALLFIAALTSKNVRHTHATGINIGSLSHDVAVRIASDYTYNYANNDSDTHDIVTRAVHIVMVRAYGPYVRAVGWTNNQRVMVEDTHNTLDSAFHVLDGRGCPQCVGLNPTCRDEHGRRYCLDQNVCRYNEMTL